MEMDEFGRKKTETKKYQVTFEQLALVLDVNGLVFGTLELEEFDVA